MKDVLINFLKKPFIRNVIILSTGTAAAQVVNLLLIPLITRIYGPEAYGVMGAFTALTTIITPIAALTYPVAIVLPKKNQDALGLIKLSLLISLIFSILLYLALLLFKENIINIFQLDNLAPYLYLIPLVVLFAGILQVTEQWLIRTKQFRITAKATLFQAILTNGGKAGIGLVYPSASVLVVFTAFTQFVKSLLLLLFCKNSRHSLLNSLASNNVSIKKLANKHIDFPLYRAPEAFLHAITNGIPVLMLASFFGPASAGFYSIGRTVLQIPIRLVGKSVGDVFYPRISEAAHKRENLTNLIKKATLLLAIIGIIPFSLIFFFGPWLFSIVFGSEWIVAGEYARWMAFGLFFGFLRGPSIRALPVLSAQAFFLIYSIIILVGRVGFLALGYYMFSSDIMAVALFSISGAILNLGLILITLLISKRFDKKQ